jgi:hypothetical protein
MNYNHLATLTDLVPINGRANATLNLTFPVSNRFRMMALTSMGLDSQNRNALMQMSYQLSPKWRLDLLHSLYRLGGFGAADSQLGIARAFGNRELGLYWDTAERRFIFELGAARF